MRHESYYPKAVSGLERICQDELKLNNLSQERGSVMQLIGIHLR